ncbi:type II toxin-antitoxin system PemK/MazF family toxin [Candidatus Pacearchaeota archaeon]|nr:type II toxin-antitoxin system PemK/MazF family toxin [Candidatus Pacearchaeota archaeon]
MKKGEIWYVEIPESNGHEQKGLRPAVVLYESEANTAIIIPFTSNIQSLRYSNTLEIKPSKINGLNSDSVLLLFQVRTIDKKRLKNKIGFLGDKELKIIDAILKKMLKLD